MKITFNVNNVVGQLTSVSSVVNQKNILPILDCFMCVAVKDKQALRVVASDNETWVGCTIHADSLYADDTYGSFCVNAKGFASAMNNLKDKKVVVDIDGKENMMVCNHSSGRFKLPLENCGVYPLPSVVTEPFLDIVLDAHVVADMISKTKNFVSNMVIYPQLGGIHFDFTDDNITVVASDGFRMVRTRSTYKKMSGKAGGFTVHQKAASIIMSIMQSSDDGEYVHIVSDGNNASFQIGEWKVTTRLIATAYPNFDRMLVVDGYFNAHVNAKELCVAVKRVLGFGNNESKLVVLTIGKDSISIVAENIDYSTSAEEYVDCRTDDDRGEPFRIGINGGALMQMLQNITTDNATIKFLSKERALMFFNEDDECGNTYVSLLLPIQINQ